MNPFQGAVDAATTATNLQLCGALLFGVVIGWFIYFTNRYRTEEVKLADVATLIAAIGAGAILVLFPAGTDLFGAYGIGLFIGFFAYFAMLMLMIRKAGTGWTFEWFLDGRVPTLKDGQTYPDKPQHPMGTQGGPR